MGIYEYACPKCDKDVEIIRSISEQSDIVDNKIPDLCPDCKIPMDRVWSSSIYFTGTRIEDAEFNVGLGKITKSKRHRDEIAKSMGLEEIGNENPDKIHAKNEKDKAERIKKRWDSV